MTEAETESIAAFIHTSEVPTTVADPNKPYGPVISSNAAFQELTGYSIQDTWIRNLSSHWPEQT